MSFRAEAGAERHVEDRCHRAEETISRGTERLEAVRSQPERIHPANEQSALERIEAARAERDRLSEVGHEARARVAVAEHVLAERERAAATAARLSPPDYIKRELGERPSDPTKAAAWDRAVRGIEGYPVRNGVMDRDSAARAEAEGLGTAGRAKADQGAAAARTVLKLKHRTVERSKGLGIGR